MQYEGYCCRCKARRAMADAAQETMRDGRRAVKGKCPECGVVMFRIIGNKLGATTDAEEARDGAEVQAALPEGPGSVGMAAYLDAGAKRRG